MNIILDEIEIVENVLTPEDFVRFRTATGFADIKGGISYDPFRTCYTR